MSSLSRLLYLFISQFFSALSSCIGVRWFLPLAKVWILIDFVVILSLRASVMLLLSHSSWRLLSWFLSKPLNRWDIGLLQICQFLIWSMRRLSSYLLRLIGQSQWAGVGRFTHVVVDLVWLSWFWPPGKPSSWIELFLLWIHEFHLLVIARSLSLAELVQSSRGFFWGIMFWLRPLHNLSLWLVFIESNSWGLVLQLAFCRFVKEITKVSHSLRLGSWFSFGKAVLLLMTGRPFLFSLLGWLSFLIVRLGGLIQNLLCISTWRQIKVWVALVFSHSC